MAAVSNTCWTESQSSSTSSSFGAKGEEERYRLWAREEYFVCVDVNYVFLLLCDLWEEKWWLYVLFIWETSDTSTVEVFSRASWIILVHLYADDIIITALSCWWRKRFSRRASTQSPALSSVLRLFILGNGSESGRPASKHSGAL